MKIKIQRSKPFKVKAINKTIHMYGADSAYRTEFDYFNLMEGECITYQPYR